MTRTALLRTATLALMALLSCISTVSAADPLTATIVERGIYTLDTGERSRQPSGVMTTTVSNLCHILSTTTIPARRNLWFGFRYRLDGPVNGTLVTLRLVTHFPVPVKPPRTSREVTSYERVIGATVGVAQFTGYGFEEDWEFMPGPWIFELFEGDRLLTQQRFMVVRDNNEPALSGDGRLNCFAMTRLDGPAFNSQAL